MKRWLLAAGIVLLATELRAEAASVRFGAFAYPTLSWLLVNTDPTVGLPRVGWGAGASLEIGPLRWLGFELAGLYTRRSVSGPLSSISSFTYVQVPLLLKFTPVSWLSFGVGAYGGYALGDVSNTGPAGDAQLAYADLGYTRLDWGAAGSFGVQFRIRGPIAFFLDGRFMYGLQNIEAEPVGGSVSQWMEASVWGGLRIGNF